jgi:hypothetical protein
VKLMLDLPLSTHRNLIEPLSGQMHLRKILVKRFLSFISQIEKSSKIVPKILLNCIKSDVRSTSGRNLRKILLLTGKLNVQTLNLNDYKSVKYHQLGDAETWKVSHLKELIDIKFGKLQIENFVPEEIEDMINFVSTS